MVEENKEVELEKNKEEENKEEQNLEGNEEKMEEIIKILDEAKKNGYRVPAKIVISPFIFPNKWLSLFAFYIVNLLVVFSLIGLLRLKEFNSILLIVLYAFNLSIAEMFFKLILFRYFKVYILKTYGMISYLLSFVTIMVFNALLYNYVFESYIILFSFVCFFLIERMAVIYFVRKYYFLHTLKRGKK